MNNPLRIKITGDAGDPKSIEVIDAKTGERLTNVLAVDVHLDAVDCRVTLTVFGAEIDLEANAAVEEIAP